MIKFVYLTMILLGMTIVSPAMLLAQTTANDATAVDQSPSSATSTMRSHDPVLMLAATGIVSMAFGEFGEIAAAGAGGELSFEADNLIFSGLALKFASRIGNVVELSPFTDSFWQFGFFLGAGYRIELGEVLVFTPLVSGGYLFHVIDSGGETYLFGDPAARAELMLSWEFKDDFIVQFSPQAHMFFEEDRIGLILGFGFGLATSFRFHSDSSGGGFYRTIQLFRDNEFFSPNGDGVKDSVKIIAAIVRSYDSFTLQILDSANKPVLTRTGGPLDPVDYEWKGMLENNEVAPDGVYCALLTTNSNGVMRKTTSPSFTLDKKVIEAGLKIIPGNISPDNDGENDTVEFIITTADNETPDSWILSIIDPAGNLFRKYHGTHAIPKSIVWDGRSPTGELVQSADIYPVTASLSDAAGNKTNLDGKVISDIIVLRQGGRMKIIIPSINFPGDSANFHEGSAEQVRKNAEIIAKVAEILNRFPNVKIRVEGFAINITGTDPESISRENINELIPLSQRRADNIRAEIIRLGIKSENIAAYGRGNADPIIPPSDKANVWKNRRVEFILDIEEDK
ncbi:MAG: hypothetical protein EHM28_00245 [Spirochaetaceae bacterium]|nr:MAG: hypothetical protein EHM28_00245 [Spirochaetaceae bacterium]